MVAALCRRGEAVLAQRRPAGTSRAGLWELPGGTVEAGEADAAALQRELAEELGVAGTVGRRYFEGRHAYADLIVHLVVYEVELGAEPRPGPGAELAWVERQALESLAWTDADVPVVDLLRRG